VHFVYLSAQIAQPVGERIPCYIGARQEYSLALYVTYLLYNRLGDIGTRHEYDCAAQLFE